MSWIASDETDTLLETENIRCFHTDYENFNFADDHVIIWQWYLNDDESERWQVVLAVQRDSRCTRYGARVLATQCVVPQGRFWDVRINIRQTDDEIVQLVRCMTACIYIRRRTMRYRHWDKIMSTVLTANTSRQRTFEKLDYSTSDCKYGQNCSSLPWDVILYHGPVTPCELINSFNYVLFTRSMLLHGRELPQYDVCL